MKFISLLLFSSDNALVMIVARTPRKYEQVSLSFSDGVIVLAPSNQSPFLPTVHAYNSARRVYFQTIKMDHTGWNVCHLKTLRSAACSSCFAPKREQNNSFLLKVKREQSCLNNSNYRSPCVQVNICRCKAQKLNYKNKAYIHTYIHTYMIYLIKQVTDQLARR